MFQDISNGTDGMEEDSQASKNATYDAQSTYTAGDSLNGEATSEDARGHHHSQVREPNICVSSRVNQTLVALLNLEALTL